MEILHISDIHFRIQYEKRQDGYGKMLCQMRNPLEKLDFCLEKAFSEHPGIGLVLISGDLCEDGSAADYESLRKFLESRLGTVPMEITLGNHDRKEEFRKGWMGKEEQNLPYNIDHTGGLYNHALRLEELAVLSMDSSCYGNSNGQIEEEAVQWLEEMIQKNTDAGGQLPGEPEKSDCKYRNFGGAVRPHPPLFCRNVPWKAVLYSGLHVVLRNKSGGRPGEI